VYNMKIFGFDDAAVFIEQYFQDRLRT